MNFLLRPSPTVAAEQPSVNGSNTDAHKMSRPVTTLEGLIAEDSFPPINSVADSGGEAARYEDVNIVGSATSSDASVLGKHSDVSEEEGWITIPSKKLPENWNDAPDVQSLRSLDRSFVFPGEQIHVLACLSANEQDMEIITPFKVAAVMSKNGIGQSGRKVNGLLGDGTDAVSDNAEVHADGQDTEQNGVNPLKGNSDTQKDFSAGESLLRMEDQKRKTETLLQKFKSSHFFVRIAESHEMLWSKRGAHTTSSHTSVKDDQSSTANESSVAKDMSRLNAIIDKGNFDANVSGGVARNAVQCHSLANGDVVVLLQVNVGVNLSENPVLEILQFEKHQTKNVLCDSRDDVFHAKQEPCGELLTWLLPLDNTLSPPPRSLSPPPLSSNPGIGNTSQRPNLAGTSGSQLFSFGNFRSYSMSALPQTTAPPPAPVTAPSSKPKFELEDWDRFSYQKSVKNQKTGKELLSFRGVSLEPERFSVCCGLQGVYIPGRRWRRKLEIIQPIEIHSFSADCNTDDLLCVQIKNVSPAHVPEIVVYIDAITIVLEEAVKGGPPLSLPIASIEAGDGCSLPNLALRGGEEHSFILKPAISAWKKFSAQDRKGTQLSQLMGGTTSTLGVSSKIIEGKSSPSASDHYAVMVSCHCNYTESRLFFKQPTSWRPRISRDIMISVASEMSRECPGPNGMVPQLPVQVLTLQASNLASEDLTMTILAPASFTSPPSVLSLNSSPSSPISPFLGLSEVPGKYSSHTHGSAMHQSSVVAPLLENKSDVHSETKLVPSNEQASSPVSDAISTSGFGCTHLWLHSRVPLGCVPSQTTATIKLELLPLTDGIITLDTLQIDVKEKGLTYIPENSLKINATSSISTGII